MFYIEQTSHKLISQSRATVIPMDINSFNNQSNQMNYFFVPFVVPGAGIQRKEPLEETWPQRVPYDLPNRISTFFQIQCNGCHLPCGRLGWRHPWRNRNRSRS